MNDKWGQCLQVNCDEMVRDLVACIQRCVDEVAVKKVATAYSRPWINHTIAEQLKKLRKARRKHRLHKSRVNCSEYEKIKQETIALIKKAEEDWYL